MSPTVHIAPFAELTTTTLYALLRLRVDVFVVEQRAAYPDLDGRDLEPDARHVWIDGPDGAPVAYLRILIDDGPDGGPEPRIGRVVVAKHARGDGHAARLMDAALAAIGERPSTLDAQSYLAGFYARYGYVATGPEYTDDDGIPHIPMRRQPSRPAQDRPAQDRPAQDRPAQDRPAQDRPAQA